MVMKTGHEWLLVESSKLQDRRERNCVSRHVTIINQSINIPLIKAWQNASLYTTG